jgi:hypothetical protein
MALMALTSGVDVLVSEYPPLPLVFLLAIELSFPFTSHGVPFHFILTATLV